jgi:hypothetical protein
VTKVTPSLMLTLCERFAANEEVMRETRYRASATGASGFRMPLNDHGLGGLR